ncbi:hypothetical protein HZA55_01295 [Candidatus Poribacteria bacterium]|nr:hypothetical protein [Candidatus Poribacteria bacterium]
MSQNRYKLCMFLILFFLPLNLFANQESFLKFIPHNTFAYLNFKNEKKIEDIPSFVSSAFPALADKSQNILAELVIDAEPGLTVVYLSPSGILKSPAIICKVLEPNNLIKQLDKDYKIEKNSYEQFFIYTLTLNSPNPKKKSNLCLTFIDKYLVVASLSEIKIIVNTYLGKAQSFNFTDIHKEITKTIPDDPQSAGFYINIKDFMRSYELISKQMLNIAIQSVLAKGSGFAANEIKDIAQANVEQFLAYASQVHYITGQYDKKSKKTKMWTKFFTNSPLVDLTKVQAEKVKNLTFLPAKNVIMAWNILEGDTTRPAFYNYVSQRLSRFDSTKITHRKQLQPAFDKLKNFKSQETWAWLNSPEGLVFAIIIEVKDKKFDSILKSRFEPASVFFRSEQKWVSLPGESLEYNKVQIKSEKISFSPLAFNVLELSGYTGKVTSFTVWYCYMDNNLIITVENNPAMLKAIISTKKQDSLYAAIKNATQDAKNNSIVFLSPDLVSLYLNVISPDANQNTQASDTTLSGHIVKSIPIIKNLLDCQDIVVIGISKNEGFYYEFELKDKNITKKMN